MKEKIISPIIIMLSLAMFCSYHIYYYFLDKEDNNLVEEYYKKNEEKETNVVTKVNYSKKEEYRGIIRIPKINLKQGFYSIDSKNNDINKSVTILKESTMPNENGSIIYLIAHSGSGYLAFFKDLDKLKINDIIYLDIDSNSYQYIVNDIYELDMKGKIVVNHNIHDNYLILSTCGDGNRQLVVTSKLINMI